MDSDNTGFYSLSQLCSQGETDKQKAYVGIFPWSRMTIRRMIKKGEFPKPIEGVGRYLLWPKETIHEFVMKIREVEA